uniref:hypothetical protein n=1 Tax=Eubacterium cellulosolvens TaxID=29322 RepID=UPI000482CF52|nr:hypothetical protein [[Eubacterium] cellulosolvens]
MENILYMNAVLPYTYMLVIYLLSKNTELWKEIGMRVYGVCGIGILVQILVTLIVTVLSVDAKKLAEVNLRVKLIQIPFYIIYFLMASMLFALLMALMGIGIFFLPVLLAVDAAIFATTLIPAEFCAVALKTVNRISAGRMVAYLIFSSWYCVDLIPAFMMRHDFRKQTKLLYPPQNPWR